MQHEYKCGCVIRVSSDCQDTHIHTCVAHTATDNYFDGTNIFTYICKLYNGLCYKIKTQ